MATATDVLLEDNGDYQIQNGDFKVGASDQQSTVLVLNDNLGSWKFHPFCGMGIGKYIGSSGTQQIIKREIAVQLRADGFKINSIIVKNYDDFYLDHERII